MKKTFVFLFAALLAASAWCQTEITIQRADSSINSGYKERIYVDGKEVLTLGNGEVGRIIIPNGNHTIHAALSSLMTAKWPFNAQGGALSFVVTPKSSKNLAIEPASGVIVPPVVAQAPAKPAPAPKTAPKTAAKPQTGVEASLQNAADAVLEKIPKTARIAIVNVTATDKDVADFIAGELEYIFVEQGLKLVDRSELDRIRSEQKIQMSGEVDDKMAVSIGKFAGASVIITGSVTGTGDLRRLRLRALDTQTALVLSVASEKF